ncbi:MAG: glycosyltransferase family 2 protein [Candidatus Spechtbacterales bacterium]
MENNQISYLSTGGHGDLPKGNDRLLYRFLEMIPGILIWATFALAIFLSWASPIFVAFFILAFDLHWIFKVAYFSIHTRSAYSRMREHLKRDWLFELKELPPRQLIVSGQLSTVSCSDLWHLTVIPMHKEPYDIVRPVIEAIAKSHWPKERMVVVLATEEAAGRSAQVIAQKLRVDFGEKLPNFFITIHPSNLPGEIPGKGSNERWAGLWIKDNFIDRQNIPYENVIVSSLDADTVVYPHYFSCVAYHYLTCEKPLRSSFQPIPLFVNNIWEAPALSRVMAFSSTFWHTMNQERPEKHITFSSHAMPLKALVDIGFWQPNVVSEDSRIFWQCFLYYDGDYRVVSLYYPVSMDANVGRSTFRTLKNIYKQQRRWAYGAADIAYFLFGFLKNRKIQKGLMWQYGFYTAEGFFSWGTYAILIFVLGWLPLVLGGENFNTTILSYSLPRVTRVLLSIAMAGIISSVFLSIVILPPRPPNYGKWKYALMVLQWALIPLTLVVFGSFPAIEAQTRLMLGKYLGFWPTEKFRK